MVSTRSGKKARVTRPTPMERTTTRGNTRSTRSASKTKHPKVTENGRVPFDLLPESPDQSPLKPKTIAPVLKSDIKKHSIENHTNPKQHHPIKELEMHPPEEEKSAATNPEAITDLLSNSNKNKEPHIFAPLSNSNKDKEPHITAPLEQPNIQKETPHIANPKASTFKHHIDENTETQTETTDNITNPTSHKTTDNPTTNPNSDKTNAAMLPPGKHLTNPPSPGLLKHNPTTLPPVITATTAENNIPKESHPTFVITGIANRNTDTTGTPIETPLNPQKTSQPNHNNLNPTPAPITGTANRNNDTTGTPIETPPNPQKTSQPNHNNPNPTPVPNPNSTETTVTIQTLRANSIHTTPPQPTKTKETQAINNPKMDSLSKKPPKQPADPTPSQKVKIHTSIPSQPNITPNHKPYPTEEKTNETPPPDSSSDDITITKVIKPSPPKEPAIETPKSNNPNSITSQNRLKDTSLQFKKAGELQPLQEHIASTLNNLIIPIDSKYYPLYTSILHKANEIDQKRNTTIDTIMKQCNNEESIETKAYLMECLRITELEQYRKDINIHNQNLKSLIEKVTTKTSPIKNIPDMPYPPNDSNDMSHNAFSHTEYVSKLRKHYDQLKEMTQITMTLVEYTKSLPPTEKTAYMKKASEWLLQVKHQINLTETTISKAERQRDYFTAKAKKEEIFRNKDRRHLPWNHHNLTYVPPRRKFINPKNQRNDTNTPTSVSWSDHGSTTTSSNTSDRYSSHAYHQRSKSHNRTSDDNAQASQSLHKTSFTNTRSPPHHKSASHYSTASTGSSWTQPTNSDPPYTQQISPKEEWGSSPEKSTGWDLPTMSTQHQTTTQTATAWGSTSQSTPEWDSPIQNDISPTTSNTQKTSENPDPNHQQETSPNKNLTPETKSLPPIPNNPAPQIPSSQNTDTPNQQRSNPPTLEPRNTSNPSHPPSPLGSHISQKHRYSHNPHEQQQHNQNTTSQKIFKPTTLQQPPSESNRYKMNTTSTTVTDSTISTKPDFTTPPFDTEVPQITPGSDYPIYMNITVHHNTNH
jgi:hypothetical protein